jgi:signal transduction histidine kinase
MKKFLQVICEGIMSCSKKIMSATKFTDFFVHDILDYTTITKEGNNFVKNVTVFDIQDAINDLKDILEDKIKMK